MPELEGSHGNRWLTTILLPSHVSPETIRLFLEESNIESRPLWKPMHAQPLLADAACCIDGTSDSLFARGLCLPSGTSMSDEDVIRVATLISQKVLS